MAVAIHFEIDVLFFLMLCVIVYQSINNVSQQMSLVLFRYTVYGIMISLMLDAVWIVIDGRMFPGAIPINFAVNAFILSVAVIIGCVWYLYVLESLGFRITKRLICIVMLPGAVLSVIDIMSIWTGWTFTINAGNEYVRGPLFWLQTIGALGTLLISLAHILLRLARRSKTDERRTTFKLLKFYIIPVVGTLAAIPFTGMPGAWTCAAVSVILMYMDDQDREILRDSLTGLNNRKTLESAFSDYIRQTGDDIHLYLFMIDLDDFKTINDTYGHPEGDKALVNAAGILRSSLRNIRAIVMRTGGDEFLIMGFFRGDMAAQHFASHLTKSFEQFTEEEELPYDLHISVGYSMYEQGHTLAELMSAADADLYRIKKLHKELKR